MPRDPDNDPLMRLSEAVEAWIDHQRSDHAESRDDFLARHAELRDLIEPMLEEQGGAVAQEPRQLGEYLLLREVGRGGMGVVFEAEDTVLKRRVALKVLPPHLTQGPRQIERFRREASAAARLRHPGIVPVFGVGQEDGTHYFAMDFVDGPGLGTVLRDLRAAGRDFRDGFGDARLGDGLPGGYITQALEVTAQAAEAVAAAHDAGVIHRDLKPQNIMLAGGQVHIVDFGLAKDLDRHTISHSAEVAGTPAYMSPEQVQGLRDLDARSDVYSLGVVLYELLTLRPPHDGDSVQAIMHAICTQEPTPPRRLSGRVPRDVEVICLRALEKDPADRYASASELAADLRRFLRHEPIHARPPGTASRVIKLVRRRTGAATAVLLAVALPLIALAIYLVVIRPSIERESSRVSATVARARGFVQKYLVRVEELSQQPGMTKTCGEMLDEVAKELESLQQIEADPDLIMFLAQARQRIGQVRVGTGHPDEALRNFEAAEQLLEAELGRHPDHLELTSELMVARTRRAGLLVEQGRTGDAMQLLGQVREQRPQQVPEAGRARVNLAQAMAKSHITEGLVLVRLGGDMARVAKLAEDAVLQLDELPEATRDQAWSLHLRALAQTVHGAALLGGGNPDAALPRFDAARRSYERLASHQKAVLLWQRELAICRQSMAEIHLLQGRPAAARPLLDSAIEALAKLHAGFPEVATFAGNLSRGHRLLGTLLLAEKDRAGAEAAMREAVRLADTLPGGEPQVLTFLRLRAAAWGGLGQALITSAAAYRSGETDRVLAEAIALEEEILRRNPDPVAPRVDLAETLQNRAALKLAMREYAAVAADIDRAIALQREVVARRAGQDRFVGPLRNQLMVQAEARLFCRDPDGAVASTEALATAGVPTPTHKLQVARNLARAASLLPDTDPRRGGWERRAIEHARAAVEQGLDRRRLAKDAAFAILATRADWQHLIRPDPK